MLRLEKAGFSLRTLQKFITKFAEPVEISEKWMEKQELCYEYEPKLIGTVFRLKGIRIKPHQTVNHRPVYEFEPLIFSLCSEVPYTFCADRWSKVDLDKKAEVIALSLNKNSPDPTNPWLLF